MFNFPYTNFHELNLDWIINQLKNNESIIVNTDYYNVLDYGVVNDGITDNTQSIADMIDAGYTNLFFPVGDYIINGLPLITDNIHISMLGAGAPICYGEHERDNANTGFVRIITDQQFLTFDGNVFTNTGSFAAENIVFTSSLTKYQVANYNFCNQMKHGYFQRCYISGFDYVFPLVHIMTVDNCLFGENNIVFESFYDVLISNSYFAVNFTGAFMSDGASHSVITNCKIEEAMYQGARYGINIRNAWGVVIANNIFQNVDRPLYMNGCRCFNVIGNQFYGTQILDIEMINCRSMNILNTHDNGNADHQVVDVTNLYYSNLGGTIYQQDYSVVNSSLANLSDCNNTLLGAVT